MFTSVAHQIFCFSRGISSVSSFNIDSVLVKKEHPGYCKELKGTIGSFHFSTKCFTVLQEWMACLMRFLSFVRKCFQDTVEPVPCYLRYGQ